MSRSLLEARFVFSRSVGLLLPEVNAIGYDWILDEAKRSPDQARWNSTHCRVIVNGKRCEQLDISHDAPHAFKPIGSRNSVHCQGLAIDLLLFEGGQILNDPAPYRTLGELWKGYDPELRWGGDFQGFADLGHFSHEWKGRK